MAWQVYSMMNAPSVVYDDVYDDYEEEKVGVAKLQIGLLGLARELQDDLDRIAQSADTTSNRGLHFVLTETVLALLRNPDMCVYACNNGKNVTSVEAAEEAFNMFSMEERGKFESETLVNVEGRTSASSAGVASGELNEYLTVTILVAAYGGLKMPRVTDNESLKTALTRLGAVRAEDVEAVEILWTPQDRNDTLSLEEMLRDYPSMNNL